MDNDLLEKLQKRWIHSHEEDTPGEMIFRPESFPFPRSRGRTAFELKPGHMLVETGIAPSDGPQTNAGKWQLNEKNELAFFKEHSAPPSRVLQILSADGDRLVIRK